MGFLSQENFTLQTPTDKTSPRGGRFCSVHPFTAAVSITPASRSFQVRPTAAVSGRNWHFVPFPWQDRVRKENPGCSLLSPELVAPERRLPWLGILPRTQEPSWGIAAWTQVPFLGGEGSPGLGRPSLNLVRDV